MGELSEPRTRSSPAVEGGWMGLITFTPFHVPCHTIQAQGESHIRCSSLSKAGKKKF